MNIYYQWIEWAYWHKASIDISNKLWIESTNIVWVFSFYDVFEKVNIWNIWIIPIENSYAWTIHENYYLLSKYNIKIIADYYLEVNHFLLSTSNDISTIKKVYSHTQALMQCEQYINKNKFQIHKYWDTAWAAKHIKEKNNIEYASISSDLSWKIYWLNILDKNIQDQHWNKTRFFVIIKQDHYENIKNKLIHLKKSYKVSILFKTKDIPAALYKCMWAFATRWINLTKLESIPSKNNYFEYMFWIDFQKNVEEKYIEEALEELSFFCKDLKIFWEY